MSQSSILPISVVIPLFNKERHIERCIRSIFTQTVRPREIVVVNDCSTDASDLVVANMQSSTPIPITLIENAMNKGAGASRNIGVRASTSDWVGFLDADDFWQPTFCEALWRRIAEDKADFGSSGSIVRNSRSQPVSDLVQILSKANARDINAKFWKVAMSDFPINSSSVIVKRCLLDGAGGFPEDVRSYEDATLWARLWLHGKFTVENEPLSIYDRVPNGITDGRKQDRDVGLFAWRLSKVAAKGLALRRPGSVWALIFLLRFLAIWPVSAARTRIMQKPNIGAF